MAEKRQNKKPSDESTSAEQSAVVPNAAPVSSDAVASQVAGFVTNAEASYLAAVSQTVDQHASDTADQVVAIVSGYIPKTLSYTHERLDKLDGGNYAANFCDQLRSQLGVGLSAAQPAAGQLTSA